MKFKKKSFRKDFFKSSPENLKWAALPYSTVRTRGDNLMWHSVAAALLCPTVNVSNISIGGGPAGKGKLSRCWPAAGRPGLRLPTEINKWFKCNARPNEVVCPRANVTYRELRKLC